MQYSALIVEDDSDDARALADAARSCGEARGATFQFTYRTSAQDMFTDKRRYDLCFLDIDMPGINGMEAAQLLRSYDEKLPIIFVTNLAKYAVNGYEVGASGFVLKPVTPGSLSMALGRALREAERNRSRTITVRASDGVHIVPFDSLVYIDSNRHQVIYHLEDREPVDARGTLAQVEEDLGDAPILRISKGCIINMDKVVLVNAGAVRMSTGEQLPISRTRKGEVLDALTDYLGGCR